MAGLNVNFINKRALDCAADAETQIMAQGHSANAHMVLTHQTSSFIHRVSVFPTGLHQYFLTVL